MAEVNNVEAKRNCYNFHGNEQDLFIKHLSFLFAHSESSHCDSPFCSLQDKSKVYHNYPRLPGIEKVSQNSFKEFVNNWLTGTTETTCSHTLKSVPEDVKMAYVQEATTENGVE